MVVIWTPEAGRDLDKIWNYYLPLSPRSAAKIVRDIRNDVAILASGPFVAAVWDCRRSPVTMREIFFGKRS